MGLPPFHFLRCVYCCACCIFANICIACRVTILYAWREALTAHAQESTASAADIRSEGSLKTRKNRGVRLPLPLHDILQLSSYVLSLEHPRYVCRPLPPSLCPGFVSCVSCSPFQLSLASFFCPLRVLFLLPFLLVDPLPARLVLYG